MQQFAFTTGKNATDGFMIIDTMDLLYTGRFDGFAQYPVVAWTALAIRLKSRGNYYGFFFSKNTNPEAFLP